MKLYINTKSMNFSEENNEIGHEIILNISDKEFYGYDYMIELADGDEFIQHNLKMKYKKDKDGKATKEIEHKQFMVREQKTWNSFPLYEVVDGKIIPFNYRNYQYFNNTDRRMTLASKINALYNPPSELKTLRRTLKYIMNTLNIEYPDYFKKYNDKIEELINKNSKGDK